MSRISSSAGLQQSKTFANSLFLDTLKNPENLKETKYERRGGANEILGTAAGTGMMDPSMAGPMTGV